MMIRRRSLLASILLVIGLVLALVPGGSPSFAQGLQRCFAETGFCVEGRLLEFWSQNGGLPVFGLPITARMTTTIEGRSLEVQWFERNRLELHPENQRPYDVQLGRLGADRLSQQGRDWQSFPKTQAQPACRFFPETGHNVCGRILETWRASGLEMDGQRGTSEGESLALFGLPLGDAQIETVEGMQLTVQWFERARFELHPENSRPYDVLLGLLGNEVYRVGGAPPAVIGQPVSNATGAEKIAFQSKRSGKDFQIYLMNTNGSDPMQLTSGDQPAVNPSWSADGSRVMFSTKPPGSSPETQWELYSINTDHSGQTRLTSNPAIDSWASAVPNSATVLFHSNRGSNPKDFNIYAMGNTDTNAINLTPDYPGNDLAPAAAPNGHIAFESDRTGGKQYDVFVMSSNGASPYNITNNAASDGKPAWSPDGSKIAFNSNRDGNMDIYTMNVDGSNVSRLTSTEGDDKNPTWSPDSTKIAFQSMRDGNNEIYVMNADGSGQINITNNPTADDTDPTWSPIVHDLPTRLPDTQPVAVQGPTGRIAFTMMIDGNNEIFVMNANGTGAVNITQSPTDDYDPTWSPDGRKIAFTSKRDNNIDIYTINADGSGLARLTTDPDKDTNADWSPNGAQIAFNSERLSGDAMFGNAEIYVMSADGSHQTNLTNSPSHEWRPAWSPDGRQIAFESSRDNNYDIYVMNADGTGQVRLTSDPGSDEMPGWSPDGSHVVFQTDRDGKYEIYAMNADGSGQTNLSRDASQNMHPVWSPDGKYIVFMSDRDGNEDLYVMNIDGTGQSNLTNSPTDERFPAWTR